MSSYTYPHQIVARFTWLAAISIAALAPRAAAAQQTIQPAGEALTLAHVYRAVSDSGPLALAARASARAASARVPSARRPPDPRVQLGFMNYSLPDLRPMDPLGMTQLQVMQMFPTPGKLRLAGNIASSRAGAAAERARETGWELRARSAAAFYDLYRADRSLEVARATLRIVQDTRRIAEAMYRVGDGRQADVLRAQVEIARMTEDTLRMLAMRESTLGRLAALASPAAGPLSGSPVLPEFPASIPPLDSLASAAERGRPMIAAGERELEAADNAVRLARREIWPDLELGVQVGRRSGAMGMETMGSLMLGASVPIFARSRQLKMREEAAAMREMATFDLAAMRAQTRGRVIEIRSDLMRARRLADLYRTTVLPQAEATVESSLSAYRVGSVDFMTLLENRMTVNRYRLELIALESEEGMAWAELEMLLGRALVDPASVSGRRAPQ